ncbi:MAG: D-tyrosyl-tRNA(Tyr) deacylase [Halioglobus sp.]|jgi:D-tyrosyl-tRNA(Tyr) deacylase
MKALLQRVVHAQVHVDGECVGRIEQGLLVFLGLDLNDDKLKADRMLNKLLAYRMFSDESDRMNNSVADVGGGVLLISQFTLSADTRKGLRPGFSTAMPPAQALALYDYVLQRLQNLHPKVAAGVFGADMQVSLTNDGPVTFALEI